MTAFLWFKWLHLVSVISWFAGLLYLPRLFVYHAQLTDKSENEGERARLEMMERKLYGYIMMPAMMLVVASGMTLWLAFGSWGGWAHVKFALALFLVIYHFYCGHLMRNLRLRKNDHSHMWFRYINEVPTVFLLVMVWLVVFKPWS